jgi:hypothetical protein
MSTNDESTSTSIVRTCAMLVLGKLHNSPAMQLLANETSRIIKSKLENETSSAAKTEIMAALDITKDLNPDKLAADLRFEVSVTGNQIDLKRHTDPSSLEILPSGDTVSILAQTGIPIEMLLATLGFETYEALPAHLVTTRITRCESTGNNLNAIQAMLGLLAESAGLGYYLSYVASMGGLLEFLRFGHARTGKVDFEASPAEIIDFLKTADIRAVLESTTVEAHGADMALFGVPDLPLEVLSHVGSNGYNKTSGAEVLIRALGLSGTGEVTGAQLLDRDIPEPVESSTGTTSNEGPND